MATALAPYASHPDLPAFRGQPRECAAELADVGRLGETGRGMNFDVMLEAKAKDLALLRLREQLADQTGGGA